MKNQKGTTLVEALIAVAILGAIAVAIFLALNFSIKATSSVDRNTIAESLTRTALEYVKGSPYDSTNSPPFYERDPSIDLEGEPYRGRYDVTVTAERLDPENDGTDDDDGLQGITVKVYYDDDSDDVFEDEELVLTTEDYKADL